jgi:hypothetical protein
VAAFAVVVDHEDEGLVGGSRPQLSPRVLRFLIWPLKLAARSVPYLKSVTVSM